MEIPLDDHQKLIGQLQERIKELAFMYAMARMTDNAAANLATGRTKGRERDAVAAYLSRHPATLYHVGGEPHGFEEND
jgi:hypothetical protein